MGLSFVEEVLGTRVIRGEGQVAPKICRTKGKRLGGEGGGGDGTLGIKIFGQARCQTTVTSAVSVPDKNIINNIHKIEV